MHSRKKELQIDQNTRIRVPTHRHPFRVSRTFRDMRTPVLRGNRMKRSQNGAGASRRVSKRAMVPFKVWQHACQEPARTCSACDHAVKLAWLRSDVQEPEGQPHRACRLPPSSPHRAAGEPRSGRGREPQAASQRERSSTFGRPPAWTTLPSITIPGVEAMP